MGGHFVLNTACIQWHQDSNLRHSTYEFVTITIRLLLPLFYGRGSRVVKVSGRGWPCHEFELNTTKDPPCREAMHVKSVES
ncbi:hypothetical protein TNCV_1626371 [Trichonephila clavipes]|nr:hypothetical protein TNCV_1626371 [Trichonephila clavipes]